MSDSEPAHSPQQNQRAPNTSKKPSLVWALAISATIFFMMLIFPIGSFLIVPKYKQIFADILGAGESLPGLTLLILKVSDTFKNNLIIMAPIYFLFSLVCAGFIGFNRFFLSRKISKIITIMAGIIFFLGWLGLLVISALAMQLPQIKMMDKLGS